MQLRRANSITDLRKIANEARQDVIRMVTQAQAGHPGGALSCVDILVALYFEVMRVDPDNPGWEDRDRFVLSKGHASVALYAILAARGFFQKDLLMTFDHINSRLQGHVDMLKTPGVDMSSGSLGQGLSAAAGMALGGKMSARDFRVYVLLGDGEIQEGQVWEAAMFAANKKLDNLAAFIDYNKLQLYGAVAELMPIEPVFSKWQSFGWNVTEIDGHDIEQIIGAARRSEEIKGKPTVIIAHTVKGKGVSLMEGKVEWHAKAPTKEQSEQALAELQSL